MNIHLIIRKYAKFLKKVGMIILGKRCIVDFCKIVAGVNSENYELAEFDSVEEAEAELKNIYNALAQNCDYYKV